MIGISTRLLVLGAPDSTVGTRQRPVDGHLPSRDELPGHRVTDLFARPVGAPSRNSRHLARIGIDNVTSQKMTPNSMGQTQSRLCLRSVSFPSSDQSRESVRSLTTD
jgi:hypothetical protein